MKSKCAMNCILFWQRNTFLETFLVISELIIIYYLKSELSMRNECQVSLSNVMVPRMPPRKYKQILIEDMKILFRILQFKKAHPSRPCRY